MTSLVSPAHPIGAALICAVVVGCATGLAAGASTHATELWGVPLPFIAMAVAFGMQWLAFIPSYLKQTEHYYDLVGSFTYLTLVALAVAGGPRDVRAIALGLMIVVWAGRLGTFLFRRVRASGGDGRFDEIKKSSPRFLVAWTVQGLWVFVTAGAALTAMTSTTGAQIGALDAVGLVIWIVGFTIEVVADRQKTAFRRQDSGGFISSGLWAWSRHPNYFGEIVLWLGVAVLAASALSGWQFVTLVSPIFVALLLTKISGVPLLEERADKKWGGQPDYEAYKARTPVLVPSPPQGVA